MWMSDVVIIVDHRNIDRNGLVDIAAAVTDIGARVTGLDEQHHVIEASLPAHELPTIAAIEGVAYVRCVINYFCGAEPMAVG